MTFYAEPQFTKSEMMKIVVDYLHDKENSSKGSLFGVVQEVLRKRNVIGYIVENNTGREFEMNNKDRMLFNECFYDLLYGRAITPGFNKNYDDLPEFHVSNKEKLRSFIIEE